MSHPVDRRTYPQGAPVNPILDQYLAQLDLLLERTGLARFLEEEEGQSTVEYMLLISVIIIAVVAAAYIFMPSFQQGVQALAKDASSILDSGKIGKTGTSR